MSERNNPNATINRLLTVAAAAEAERRRVYRAEFAAELLERIATVKFTVYADGMTDGLELVRLWLGQMAPEITADATPEPLTVADYVTVE
jgi:hypothetical protein